jgi:protein-S-isoprenylcysteine O-methyltransferase Ste14
MLRKTGMTLLLAVGYLLPLVQRNPEWPALPLWFGLAAVIGLLLTRARPSTSSAADGGSSTHGSVVLAAAISVLLPVIEWRVRGFPGQAHPMVGQFIGLVLVFAGIALRKESRRSLEPRASSSWEPHGPYAMVRYPEHSGGLLLISGHALIYAAPYSLALVTLLMTLTYAQHIHARDNDLIARYGREYDEYRNRTARLVPRVW